MKKWLKVEAFQSLPNSTIINYTCMGKYATADRQPSRYEKSYNKRIYKIYKKTFRLTMLGPRNRARTVAAAGQLISHIFMYAKRCPAKNNSRHSTKKTAAYSNQALI